MTSALISTPVLVGKKRAIEEEEGNGSMSVDAYHAEGENIESFQSTKYKRAKSRSSGEWMEENCLNFSHGRSRTNTINSINDNSFNVNIQRDLLDPDTRVYTSSASPLNTLHPSKLRRGGGGDNCLEKAKHSNSSSFGTTQINVYDDSASTSSAAERQSSLQQQQQPPQPQSTSQGLQHTEQYLQQQQFQFQKYHDSVMLSMKTQFDIQMDKKSQECSALQESNNRLTEEVSQLRQQLEQQLQNSNHQSHGSISSSSSSSSSSSKPIEMLEHENRILKRAVAIQDGRFKEAQSQCQQLQQVLTSAAEHISRLEAANRELLAELYLLRSGSDGGGGAGGGSAAARDFFPPQPPPDVF